jgi:glycerol-3-phosphate dehydrogenase
MMFLTFYPVYTSQDVTGVELGGSLKNPLAIGAGIIEGQVITLRFFKRFHEA